MIIVISRLKEPNIAKVYRVSPDQNLINNIRVLCTKERESFRYFFPAERFHDITNGYPVPVRAAFFDGNGEYLFEIDPLKVLSEQLREHGLRPVDIGRAEIGIEVPGCTLPPPDGADGFLRRPKDIYAAGSRGAGRSGEKEDRAQEKPARTRRTSAGRSAGKRGLLAGAAAAVIAVLAVFMILMTRESAVKKFGKELDAGHYAEAVLIYNEKIYGRERMQEEADPLARSAVESVERSCREGKTDFSEAGSALTSMTGYRNRELSELAGNALKEVDLYETSSAAYKEGMSLLEKKDYIGAVRAFAGIPESSPVYEEAQAHTDFCIERIVRAAGSFQSEEDYSGAAEGLDEALEILPENEKLLAGRESARTKYENMVRNRALEEAEEKAASGDYAGAFAGIGEAMELLGQDDRLEAADARYQAGYIRHITVDVTEKVDAGDWDGAESLLEEASQVRDLEAFDSLSGQLEQAREDDRTEPAVYDAPGAEPVKFKGTIQKEGQTRRHSLKAPEDGDYRFTFSGMGKDFQVKIGILSPDGEEAGGDFGLSSGGGVTCRLEKGKKYTIEVTAYKGKGSYVLTIGQPGPAVDVSRYDVIKDRMTFKDQRNVYDFVPAGSGTCRFDLSKSAKGLMLGVVIRDSLGVTVRSASGLGAGDGLTADLSAGEPYQILVSQSGKLGEYEIRIGRQNPAADVTGRSVLGGEILYNDQKIVYNYTTGEPGRYQFTLGNMPESLRTKLLIYDSLGFKVGGSEELGNGGLVEADLESGKAYQIQLIQSEGSGRFSLTIRQ